tara:strand:- start:216 stop:671 length:456 start_codon:yes stop_codon:yes gene_type:complete
MTPFSVWENIQQYLPKDKIVWECFYGDGQSGRDLTKLGCEVIHEPIDFFTENRGEVLISNPPFSMCKEIMPRLKEIGKPFIMVMPTAKLTTCYFRDNFKDEGIQIIIPRKRIQFIKLEGGVKPVEFKFQCNFDCFYYCWKMDLPKDILFLT